MLKNGKRIKRRGKFSEDFKLKVVQEYESGQFTVLEMTKIYNLREQTIYNWIYKYSKYNKKSIQVVEMKNSQAEKSKKMEARIKELEQAVGQKQMNIDYPENYFDALILVFAHFMPAYRRRYHQKLISYLKPAGKLLLEGYAPIGW